MLKLGVLWVALAGLSAPAQDDEAQVLAAVQQFFDTMETKDVQQARDVLDPEGRFVSVRWTDGNEVVRGSSLSGFIDGLEKDGPALLERMWEPEVMIHGPIAVVWTRYDFHRDGAFSHCGVDAFQLVRSDGRWKITGGAYTVERENCPASPLGPPE